MTTAWPRHYPVCPTPIVNSIRGCDFVDAAPQRARTKVDEILNLFKTDPRFRPKVFQKLPLWGNSDQEQIRLRIKLLVLWHTLETLQPERSAVVELGTYLGTTAMGMRMVMDHLGYFYPDHVLHVYDSFEGLPAPDARDGTTELKKQTLVSSIDRYLDRFRAARLDPPYLHRGFFGAIPPSEFPREIVYAFYDGDFYESIFDSFNRTYDKMAPGGAIVIDDYFYPTLAGVERAVADWFRVPAHAAKARIYSRPALNVSHKRKYVPSPVAFANFEGVVRMAGGMSDVFARSKPRFSLGRRAEEQSAELT